ncbi:hypothetical protein LR48_Vigan10g229700, partial [Vigna angularis]
DAKKHLIQRIQNLDDKMLKQINLARSTKDEDYANYGLAYLIDFVHGKGQKMPEILQEQLKMSGKSPNLLTFKGAPNVKVFFYLVVLCFLLLFSYWQMCLG